ncbi:hypothetical protein [Mycobacterium sp. CnD-18-1]|uniref:hypothetical protein n=1 Tax=Mycobacterium sp. CnD-18-1 TaxID=2917744 RepID=UPI001EF223C1|nr:hypothetical protein [Mycobacterium sp. CnD-18-1]MCG7610345.1 hypothetical protein [Mycobacterium sp. CnD-18-1]
MARPRIKFHSEGWDAIAQHVVETEGVDRMRRVADAGNSHLDREGYKVSVEGNRKLQKRDYRATVITATDDAKYDNAKNNRLVSEFHRAGGQ